MARSVLDVEAAHLESAMHRTEADQRTECLICGAEFSLESDRSFLLSERRALCFECALERAGAHDEAHDRWTQALKLSGLPSGEWSTP
jgi:hypothetical protein